MTLFKKNGLQRLCFRAVSFHRLFRARQAADKTKIGEQRKKHRKNRCFMFRLISTVIKTDQTALVTLPERMQRVHAYTLQGEPLTTAFTLLMLGFHVLLDLLCE